jgi:aminoglycoside phosphotransferase
LLTPQYGEQIAQTLYEDLPEKEVTAIKQQLKRLHDQPPLYLTAKVKVNPNAEQQELL